MTTSGLDVSNHQGSAIDWRRVAGAGYRFAYVKASEGTTFTDRSLERNYAGAHAAGLAVGAYHFARPGASGPDVQAARLAKLLGHYTAGDLPAALDLEDDGGLSPVQLTAWALRFLERLEADLPGRSPLLYTFPSFLHDRMAGAGPVLARYRLWWARYAPALAAGDPHPIIWQHSSKGAVPGIAGSVDLNRFLGTPEQLDQLAGRRPGAVHIPARPVSPAPRESSTVPSPELIPVRVVNLSNAGDGHLVTGPGVRSLQALLQLAGFLRGPIDGRAGKGTRAALEAFQRHHFGKADGIAGASTFAALDAQ